MKKHIAFLLAVFILMLALLTGCGTPDKNLFAPGSTDLKFWIGQDVTKVDFSDYEKEPGLFSAVIYYAPGYELGDQEYIAYEVKSPVDDSEGLFVTRIRVTDPKINVWDGLTAASSFEEWDTLLTKHGYEWNDPPMETIYQSWRNWQRKDGGGSVFVYHDDKRGCGIFLQ